MSRLILASKSPRRQELLAYITRDFEVMASEAEEVYPPGVDQTEVPVYLAALKAKDVAEQRPDSLVIGADTVVLLNGRILGKPRDRDDAIGMLHALSGAEHTVVTGCCLISGNRWVTFREVTRVRFYPLSEREIIAYVDTGEPFDKAGAYGIQGQGALLVQGIDGDYYNVMGLPIARLKRELEQMKAL